MCHIQDEKADVRKRRNQLRYPYYIMLELLVKKPNELWSCDITEPADVHYGCAQAVIQLRQQVLQAAYLKISERFVNGLP
jgi:hypothetical protein